MREMAIRSDHDQSTIENREFRQMLKRLPAGDLGEMPL
jgi:hypothetical protein